ncbi:MAG: hypothetical protein H6703_11955 [Myxococcales bacterium]|nr:hypothetical protein [Myxococcales bacterium]
MIRTEAVVAGGDRSHGIAGRSFASRGHGPIPPNRMVRCPALAESSLSSSCTLTSSMIRGAAIQITDAMFVL